MQNPGFDLHADVQARADLRRPLRKRAQLCMQSRAPIDVQTVDISFGGLCIMADRPVEAGQNCSVMVEVFFKGKPLGVRLEGQVVYCMLKGTDGFRTGIRITQFDSECAQYVNSLLQ